jgi:hypothetical protein
MLGARICLLDPYVKAVENRLSPFMLRAIRCLRNPSKRILPAVGFIIL